MKAGIGDDGEHEDAHEPPAVRLHRLHHGVRACTACDLHRNRQHAVPGEGPITAAMMLVGEAPGAQEDATGRPFCGPAGEALDEALDSAGLDRSQLYITSTVKCRPPDNRDPRRGEARVCCSTWLEKQVKYVSPDLVMLLGKVPMKAVLGVDETLRDVHGDVRRRGGRHYMLSYHPAAALRFPEAARRSRDDFIRAKRFLRERQDGGSSDAV